MVSLLKKIFRKVVSFIRGERNTIWYWDDFVENRPFKYGDTVKVIGSHVYFGKTGVIGNKVNVILSIPAFEYKIINVDSGNIKFRSHNLIRYRIVLTEKKLIF